MKKQRLAKDVVYSIIGVALANVAVAVLLISATNRGSVSSESFVILAGLMACISGLAALFQMRASQLRKIRKNRLIKRKRIFLSYAPGDEKQVHQVLSRLREAGYEPVDYSGMLHSKNNWVITMRHEIEKSDYFVVFVSHNSFNERGLLNTEMKLSKDLIDEINDPKDIIIPVRLEPTRLPPTFSPKQSVDLFETDGFSKLTQKLQAI